MKYIITENKIERMVVIYLDNAFGDLSKKRFFGNPDQMPFVRDNYIYMIYYTGDGALFVDYNKFWSDISEFFNWKLKNDDLISGIKIWAKKNYGIDVNNVYESYLRQVSANEFIP